MRVETWPFVGGIKRKLIVAADIRQGWQDVGPLVLSAQVLSVAQCDQWEARAGPHLTNQKTRSRQFCSNHDPGLFSQKNTITLLLCPSGPGVGVKRLNSFNRGGTEQRALSGDLGLAWSLQVGSCPREEARERVYLPFSQQFRVSRRHTILLQLL